MKLYKTGEVVKKSGLSRQVIYSYAMLDLIKEKERTPSGHRLYDESVFHILKRIEILKKTGLTLRKIQELFQKEKKLKLV